MTLSHCSLSVYRTNSDRTVCASHCSVRQWLFHSSDTLLVLTVPVNCTCKVVVMQDPKEPKNFSEHC